MMPLHSQSGNRHRQRQRHRSSDADDDFRYHNSNNISAALFYHTQQQLISSLSRIAAEQAKSNSTGKEINTQLAEEGSLQREMLKDPRFGSPLLCDTLVMLAALVPLGCGFTAYFYGIDNADASTGYNYGLALCGIFIFLLGLRSASLHLINQIDTTEDRVRYILDKFGGSVCIPRSPQVRRFDSSGSTTMSAMMQHPSSFDEPFRVVMDPGSSSVYLLSKRRPTLLMAPASTEFSVRRSMHRV